MYVIKDVVRKFRFAYYKKKQMNVYIHFVYITYIVIGLYITIYLFIYIFEE